MKKCSQQELNVILKLHQEWINSDGARGSCADLSGYDLSGYNLRDANLRDSNMRRANLVGTDLSLANLSRVNLSGANLSTSNLRWANLKNANMRNANLNYVNLSNAFLWRTNLSGVSLSCTNLSGADLDGADLSDATLMNTIGNGSQVKTIITELYTITYTVDILQIGCQRHTFEEWANFDDVVIAAMDEGALIWWKKWKDMIFKIVEMSPAEPTIIGE